MGIEILQNGITQAAIGMEITPKGIILAAAVIFAVVLLLLNLPALSKLFRSAASALPALPVASKSQAATGSKSDVLRLLIQLQELDDLLKLGLGAQLQGLYEVLTVGHPPAEFNIGGPSEFIWDAAKMLGASAESLGIDIRPELQAIYAKMVESGSAHKPTETGP